MMPRARPSVVVCGPHTGHTAGVAVLLGDARWDVRLCGGCEELLETVCEHRPSAIVYALAHQIAVDLALLALLRQVAPDLPVVVVASAEREVRAGRPELDAVVLEQSPADGVRLRNALRAALRRSRRREPKLVAATG
jgi:DNA-binding NtrC family response regulator